MVDTTQALAPARRAATVMLARDGAQGIEVFMVKRERMVDLVSGATVFPGGKIDSDDADVELPWGTSLLGPEPDTWVAAVRETFEETGVLIAGREGDPEVVDAPVASRITAEARADILAKRLQFSQLLAREALFPAVEHMVYFARWISPEILDKRFDAHFFLVEMPDGQKATHDGQEAIAGYWVRPLELVGAADAGKLFLVPATRCNLELLGESRTVAEAMRAARARSAPTIMPRLVKDERGVRVMIPAEAGYRTTEHIIERT